MNEIYIINKIMCLLLTLIFTSSVSNKAHTEQMILESIEMQKNKLMYETKIHSSLLRGFRSSIQNKNEQSLDNLKRLGFDYDSSSSAKQSSLKKWPYKVNSFWKVPLKYFQNSYGNI